MTPTLIKGARYLTLKETLRNHTIQTLTDCGGDKKKTSELLGISYTTLFRKLHEYGVFKQFAVRG